MGLYVSEIHRKIADLREGEEIIGKHARAGDEFDLKQLAFQVQARLDIDAETFTATDPPKIEGQRCGWMEEPPPDTREGIHESPLGQLWVVYRKVGVGVSAE